MKKEWIAQPIIRAGEPRAEVLELAAARAMIVDVISSRAAECREIPKTLVLAERCLAQVIAMENDWVSGQTAKARKNPGWYAT